jgi:hypothetical protein
MDRADFYLVYIREAHPSDGRRPAIVLDPATGEPLDIEQPKTFDRRQEVAQGCKEALSLTIPMVVDDMQDTVAKAYNAHPDRLFILSADGKVAYRGNRGPRGFDVDGMEEALVKLLADADRNAPPR